MSFLNLTLNSWMCLDAPARPRARFGESEAWLAALSVGFVAASAVVLGALAAAFPG